jgi:homogentisate phytyltransferase/homogentisate geranylgeranyltransferase
MHSFLNLCLLHAATILPSAKHLQANLDSQKEITDCYMFVWKLFYAEYLLIPLLL